MTSADAMQPVLALGTEIAGYRVESFISRGGMALVYRAHDRRLGRRVALKLLAPQLSQDERFQQRFLRELQLAASLDHPNIIPIYEAGEASGLLYVVMRYVEGSDMKQLLEREGPLDLARILSILRQVGAALDAAHARGLVHRDVKPGNILIVSGTGREDPDHVYLTDFGLAKDSPSPSEETTSWRFIGTMDYVAPEQIGGKPVDGRTDIYSLGCVVYQALTGEPPFDRDDEAALLWAHLVERPPGVSARRPDVPHGVDAVVAKAMAKAPEDRHGSCRELVAELKAAIHGQAEVREPGRQETVARRNVQADEGSWRPNEGNSALEVVVRDAWGSNDDGLAASIRTSLLERYDPQSATTAALTASDHGAWEELRKALDEAAQRRGPDPIHQGLSSLASAEPWMVTIAVPLSALMTSFLSEAGKDAYLAFKRTVGNIAEVAHQRYDSSRGRGGYIECKDSATGVSLRLENLPKAAYKELASLVLPSLPAEYILGRMWWVGGNWRRRGRWHLMVSVPVPGRDADPRSGQRDRASITVQWQAAEHRWIVVPD
jgi:serine/threonine protein kinase